MIIFSFFHEVGHIILHGKKGVFLESLEEHEQDLRKENEVNNLAKKWLLSEDTTADLPDSITENDIIRLVHNHNTDEMLLL